LLSRTAEMLPCVGRLGCQLPKSRTWGPISISRAMIHDDSIVLTPLTPAMIQVNPVDIFAGFTGFLRTLDSINNFAAYRGLRARFSRESVAALGSVVNGTYGM
ncbi:MAG: hypothetical protein DMG53_16200, partial [Acidobacteria bacterium]